MNIRESDQLQVILPNEIPVIDDRYKLPADCKTIAAMYSQGLSRPDLEPHLLRLLEQVSGIKDLQALGITIRDRSSLDFYAFTDLRNLSQYTEPEKSVTQQMRNAYREFVLSSKQISARVIYINSLGQPLEQYLPEIVNELFGENRTNPYSLIRPDIPLFTIARIQRD